MSFSEERLLFGQSVTFHQSVLYGSDGCPSGFYHVHTGPLELGQSDCQLLGHLSYQVPSPLLAQFGWAAISRKRVLVVLNFFHVRIMEAAVLLGTFSEADFFISFPRSVPRHNPASELCR